jgi:predicted N-acyltransferase
MSSPQQRPLMPPARFSARYVESLELVGAEAWDACANPPGLPEAEAGERHNPFVSHAFLLALEQSKSVGGRTGWASAHVLVEDEAGRLVAAAPTYLKTHSMGEYVFDHSWAQAYEHAGGHYYPKVQVAAPFTPATGRRQARGTP